MLLVPCCEVKQANNSPLPKSTSGWQKIRLSPSTTIYGDFVLYKGQSVNDGKYGIEVIDLYPAKCSFFDNPGEDLPSARLRIFKVVDNVTLCDFRFIRGSALLDDSIASNSRELIWSAVEVTAVNTSERWVAFNLRLKSNE